MSVTKKEVIAIRKTIPAGADLTISERIKGAGTVEGLRVRFYPGQEGDLHVYPYVQHKGNKNESLITFPEGTEAYLSGDDDRQEYPVTIPVENDDELKIRAINTDSTYEYTLAVDVVIDYYGGKARVV